MHKVRMYWATLSMCEEHTIPVVTQTSDNNRNVYRLFVTNINKQKINHLSPAKLQNTPIYRPYMRIGAR